MKPITFSRVNTHSYNWFLCIVLSLIVVVVTYGHTAVLLNNVKNGWFFSMEFVKFILIVMCYAAPVTYFLSKVYEISTSGNLEEKSNAILGFIACCILLLPLAFIGLLMLAKLGFIIPAGITVVIAYIYIRSILAAKAIPVV